MAFVAHVDDQTFKIGERMIIGSVALAQPDSLSRSSTHNFTMTPFTQIPLRPESMHERTMSISIERAENLL
jgi:hypothetical protein